MGYKSPAGFFALSEGFEIRDDTVREANVNGFGGNLAHGNMSTTLPPITSAPVPRVPGIDSVHSKHVS